MKLFELKNHVVEFAPQALLLEPFNKIWKRDKSKGKLVATSELAYVWYMEDVRSDFFDIIEEGIRHDEVLKYLINLPKGWKPDQCIKEAREFYITMSETVSTKFLKDTMTMINNLRATMRTRDFEERDKSGRPVYDGTKAVDLANKIPALLITLREIYREIEKETDEEHLMRGGRRKAVFEDGI